MSSKRILFNKAYSLTAFVIVVVILTLQVVLPVRAAELANRSVFISSSFAGEVVRHSFDFETVGTSTIGSIGFLYCTNSPLHEDPCVAPVGLDVDQATISAQIGINGFVMSGSSTVNNLVITRIPAVNPATSASFSFSNITNPSTVNEIVYVRISVFDSSNGTGSLVDRGSVVFVVDDRFDISAFVPPYMTFCVGVTVALDCSATASAFLNLGEFSRLTSSVGTTQFSVATNDGDGYNVFLTGQTMTAGNNIIPALTTQSPSNTGTSQFGINLRANSSPFVGADPDNGIVSSGQPDPAYNTPNLYRFVNGDRVAGSSLATGFNRYTVSYIVNVSNEQAPGIYASTLTYTAIASF